MTIGSVVRLKGNCDGHIVWMTVDRITDTYVWAAWFDIHDALHRDRFSRAAVTMRT